MTKNRERRNPTTRPCSRSSCSTASRPASHGITILGIVTTSANRLVGQLHDRMPAILAPEAFAAWLDVDGVDAVKALALVRPAPEEALELVEIGPPSIASPTTTPACRSRSPRRSLRGRGRRCSETAHCEECSDSIQGRRAPRDPPGAPILRLARCQSGRWTGGVDHLHSFRTGLKSAGADLADVC